MSDFQTFIESVQHVPTEFERSIDLVKILDTRISKVVESVKAIEEQYKLTRSRRERARLRKEWDKYTDQLESLGLDKTEVIQQTYQLIDNTINQLLSLVKTNNEEIETKPIGVEMPVDPNEPRYCLCRGVSYGQMIACDNKDCPTEWFHIGCVNLRCVPTGKWYCDECSVSVKRSKKRRK